MTTTDPNKVAEAERGVIRVFAIDLPADRLAAFRSTDAMGDWPLGEALGVGALDDDYVEILKIADLGDFGLADYLMQGLGAREDEIESDRQMLAGIDGTLLILTSPAFSGLPVTLDPQPPLYWVGTYHEDIPEVRFEPLPTASADLRPATPAPQALPPMPPDRGGLRLAVWLLIAIAAMAGAAYYVLMMR